MIAAVERIRFIIAVGFFSIGSAFLFSSMLVPDIDFRTLVLMRAAQTAGLAFLFVPIATITSPMSAVTLAPSLLMMRAVMPMDMTATMSVWGRNASPVTTELKPSTCWK